MNEPSENQEKGVDVKKKDTGLPFSSIFIIAVVIVFFKFLDDDPYSSLEREALMRQAVEETADKMLVVPSESQEQITGHEVNQRIDDAVVLIEAFSQKGQQAIASKASVCTLAQQQAKACFAQHYLQNSVIQKGFEDFVSPLLRSFRAHLREHEQTKDRVDDVLLHLSVSYIYQPKPMNHLMIVMKYAPENWAPQVEIIRASLDKLKVSGHEGVQIVAFPKGKKQVESSWNPEFEPEPLNIAYDVYGMGESYINRPLETQFLEPSQLSERIDILGVLSIMAKHLYQSFFDSSESKKIEGQEKPK